MFQLFLFLFKFKASIPWPRGQDLKKKKALKTTKQAGEKEAGLLFVPSLAIDNAKENFCVCENCAGLIRASGKIEYFLEYTWKIEHFLESV